MSPSAGDLDCIAEAQRAYLRELDRRVVEVSDETSAPGDGLAIAPSTSLIEAARLFLVKMRRGMPNDT
eukprot:13571941-Alexandrium_andersonii.AAC.1